MEEEMKKKEKESKKSNLNDNLRYVIAQISLKN